MRASAGDPGALENPLIEPNTSLREVAFAVGTVLERAGIEAVLCGGSAATFYAPEAYQSEDLDFVLELGTDGSSVRAALASLGYRFNNGLFVHADSHFTVEFPPGPLAIGDRPPIEVMDAARRRQGTENYQPDRFGMRSPQ